MKIKRTKIEAIQKKITKLKEEAKLYATHSYSKAKAEGTILGLELAIKLIKSTQK